VAYPYSTSLLARCILQVGGVSHTSHAGIEESDVKALCELWLQLYKRHIDTEIQPLGLLYSGSPFPYSAVSRIVPERRGKKYTVGLNVR